MRPIRTERSNQVWRGDGSTVQDLWAERTEIQGQGSLDGALVTYEVWEPSPEEREHIARGGNIQIGIVYAPKIPPLSVETTELQEFDGESQGQK